jgi:23S rRNA pseudouridine1911/1915/1917 synthase
LNVVFMSGRVDTIVVEESLPLGRLDAFLRERFPELSRAAIQRLIGEGQILVDGKLSKPAHHPRAGEAISVHWPEPREAQAQPEQMTLSILFEDADLLVLNKPAGLVVHPAAGHAEHTLVNALLHHCKGQLSGIGGVARPGIVHRLDKDTSGCLVAAKNDAAHAALAKQFSGRKIVKIYHTLVCGVLPRDSGEIDAPIARHPVLRKCMAVVKGGREARTSYRVLRRWAAATLVEARLHTGRTHQIRVHFLHLGFPVAGDPVYGKRQNKRFEEQSGVAAPRLMLHAFKLGFAHPRTGETILCEAPLPDDFQTTLAALK